MWQMLLADLTEPEKNTNVEEIKGLSLDFQSRHVVVSAQVRIILTELPLEEHEESLNSLGKYFTSGEKETKAWTIHACGIIASEATGVIHSDFEKGFIRTETHFYPLNEYVGQKLDCLFVQLRSEGIVYIVKEGYFMLFLFNI
ncbi:BnaCnng40880D [Brassica napus]|uniref:BnaCnng40880D protein n=1 Tax=Brassica napus TaxID=3708 RepID=A0A078J7Q0_BRANA|nr:BnaCnng40880D [Brassica napus]